jgi:SPP1 gp7 family putative phage head morphogenesis protein
MQKNMTTLFQQYMQGDVPPEEMEWYEDRLPAYRTENIARTESMRASSAGSQELYNEWGVERKEWLATADDRTRPEHTEANGQVVGINEPFDVGGEQLMYPGDPDGSPENTCQCRCTLLPVME